MSEKSTMKVTEHVIITERKRHPNDVRYPCRGSHEVLDAGRKLITFLHNDDPSQLDLLKEGKLIIDEEETAELYDSFQEDDVIGLGIFRPTGHVNAGFTSNMYTIEKIHEDEDYMECRNMRSAEIEEISFQDVSVALALGLAEILYRDEKPFGISNEQEWKILLPDSEDEDEEDASTSGQPQATSAASGTAQTSAPSASDEEDEVESAEDAANDMMSDLGVGTQTNEDKTPAPEMSEEEVQAALAEKLDPRFFAKREKLTYLQIQKLEPGDVVWVHATTNLGQVMKKGPLAVASIEGDVYTFTDVTGDEDEINIVDDWDDYAEHFMSGGGFYNFFYAKDSRPKPESEASANDDSEKLIKAMGLDKKAKEEQEKAEQQEKPLRWNDCYFAFAWNDGTYCLVVCPKEHWDEKGTLDDGAKTKHLAEQVGLKELSPAVYDYTEAYNETSLRMLFKAFGCEENTKMADTL